MTRAPDGARDGPIFVPAFLIFASLAAIWAVTTPIMASPDEPAHAIRAAAIVRGELLGTARVVRTGDPKVVDGTFHRVTVPEAYAHLPALSPFAHQPSVKADIAPPVSTGMAPTPADTGAATYPPLYYVVVGWPTLLLPPLQAIYAMRILSGLICAALLAAGIVSARRADRSGALLVGAVAAITPTSLFFFGAINPSALEIAAAACAWLSAIEVFGSEGPVDRGALTRLTASAVLLASCRQLSIPFLGFILICAALAVGTPGRIRRLAEETRVRRAAALIALACLATAAWVLWTGALGVFSGYPRPDLTPATAFLGSLERFPNRVDEMIAVLGWLDTHLPSYAIRSWVVAVAGMVAAGLALGSGPARLSLLACVVVTPLLPALAEARTAPAVGFLWQGRYGLPVSMGLPILAAAMIGRSGRAPAWLLRAGAAAALVGFAAVHTLAHVVSMRRYIVGVGVGERRRLFLYLDEPGWSPPLPPALLLGAQVVMGLLLAAWILAHVAQAPAATRGRLGVERCLVISGLAFAAMLLVAVSAGDIRLPWRTLVPALVGLSALLFGALYAAGALRERYLAGPRAPSPSPGAGDASP